MFKVLVIAMCLLLDWLLTGVTGFVVLLNICDLVAGYLVAGYLWFVTLIVLGSATLLFCGGLLVTVFDVV